MLARSVTYQAQIYEVKLIKEDDGGYSASVPSVPGAYSDGDTEAEALENIADAIAMLKETTEEAADILREYERKEKYRGSEAKYPSHAIQAVPFELEHCETY